MAQKIIISQFGPLHKVELPLSDVHIFIGPQAGGKSTISKAVYFFKSLRDDFFILLRNLLKYDVDEKPLTLFSKNIRAKFLQYWGPTSHLDNFYLKFCYGNDSYIEILLNQKNKFIDIIFSDNIKNDLFDLTNKALELKNMNSIKSPFKTSAELFKMDVEYDDFLEQTKLYLEKLFQDDRDLIFIPAGRSLLATLSDQIIILESSQLDFLTKQFIERINSIKKLFTDDLYKIFENRLHTSSGKVNENAVKKSINLIENIIKGTFISDYKGDRIYLSDDKYIKFNYASSGQQESIWILLLIYLIILDNKKVSIVIEEPEAHLYPISQKLIVDLMAVLINQGSNNIIITTHSPYILSSFNNLLYAYQVGQKKDKDVSNIIERELWVNPVKLKAHFVRAGGIIDIIDQETKLIDSQWIDEASEIINEKFDELFALED